MRWLKLILGVSLILFGIYCIAMLFVDDEKQYTIHKTINYPIDKVYPQFSNFQNLKEWNAFFNENENYTFTFYTPYEGIGSSVHFEDKNNKNDFVDAFIRYENPKHSLKFQIFRGDENNPYRIDLKFTKKHNNSTEIVWYVSTPKAKFLKRSTNLVSGDYIKEKIDKSMLNLAQTLSGKVDQEKVLANIKYDTLFIENSKPSLLLGIYSTANNKKNDFFNNIVMSHNKLINFVTKDLSKKDDEFGVPTLITEVNNLKNNEISYFYGVSLPKRITINDNNFNFRNLEAFKVYYMYYKGSYSARNKTISQLKSQVEKDNLRAVHLAESFIEPPEEGKDCKLKIQIYAK